MSPIAPDGTIYNGPDDEKMDILLERVIILTKMVDTIIGLQLRLIDRDKMRQEVLAVKRAMQEAMEDTRLAAEAAAEAEPQPVNDPALD